MFMNRRDSNLYLCNPFSPSTSPIIPLPPIETLPSVTFRRRRSEPDEPVPTSHEMEFEFVMEDWYNTKDLDGPNFEGDWEEVRVYREEKTKKKWYDVSVLSPFEPNIVPSEDLIEKGFIHKMALSCAPPSPSNNYTNKCIVAIVYGSSRTLATCKLGDNTWTRLDGWLYTDITFSRHDESCLYTWDWDNQYIKSCNLSNPKSPEWNVIARLDFVACYLVESATEQGNLLAIGRSDSDRVMKVYKVDTATKSCEEVRSLNDQVLFVGDFSETMSVPASELPPQVKPNCIYLTNFYSFDMGLFDLGKGVVNYQFEGLNLNLSLREESYHNYYVRPEFRKKCEGWPVWVMPNPW